MRRKCGEETGLIRILLEYLALKKVWAYRVNSGSLRNPQGRPVKFGVPGHPDIVARLKPVGYTGFSGRVVWIEAKSKKGKLTESQIEWRERAALYGDIYITARRLEDIMEVFE